MPSGPSSTPSSTPTCRFEAIVEDLVAERSEAHAPIVQAMFVWQNTPAPITAVGGLTLTAERLDKGATQFDLVLDMTEGAAGIEAMLEYRTQLFDPETIERFSAAFRHLLAQALAAPDGSVADLAPHARRPPGPTSRCPTSRTFAWTPCSTPTRRASRRDRRHLRGGGRHGHEPDLA